jgi:hypothetical protein
VHRQRLLCRVLFLGHSANLFAECQRALGKEKRPLRRRVTETAALPSVSVDTRQRRYLCRVSSRQHSAKPPSLPSASWDTRQRARQGGSPCQALCRVPATSHSVKNLSRCPGLCSLPSVTLGKVTSMYLFYLFFVFHPHKQKISHIGKVTSMYLFAECCILCRVPTCAECLALGKGALCREPNFIECGTR